MADIITQIFNMLLWVFIAGIVIIVMVFFYLFSKYKHNVTLKINTSKGNIVKIVKAMETKDGMHWKLTHKRMLIPNPPLEVREINDKGKVHVTAYISENGECSFQRDDWGFKSMPEFLKEIKKKDKNEYNKQRDLWIKQNYVIPSDPFTPNQKAVLIEQERRREENKKKSFLKMFENLAPLLACVVIVLALMVLYGSIVEPSLEMGDKMGDIQQIQLEIITQQKEITSSMNNLIKGTQIIDGKDIIKQLKKDKEDKNE